MVARGSPIHSPSGLLRALFWVWWPLFGASLLVPIEMVAHHVLRRLKPSDFAIGPLSVLVPYPVLVAAALAVPLAALVAFFYLVVYFVEFERRSRKMPAIYALPLWSALVGVLVAAAVALAL